MEDLTGSPVDVADLAFLNAGIGTGAGLLGDDLVDRSAEYSPCGSRAFLRLDQLVMLPPDRFSVWPVRYDDSADAR